MEDLRGLGEERGLGGKLFTETRTYTEFSKCTIVKNVLKFSTKEQNEPACKMVLRA